MQLPYMTTLRWMRIPGDTPFAIAAMAIVAFLFGAGPPRSDELRRESATPAQPAGDPDHLRIVERRGPHTYDAPMLRPLSLCACALVLSLSALIFLSEA